MDTATHDLPTLFAQLGLENSDAAIEDFIHQYAGTLKDSMHAFWLRLFVKTRIGPKRWTV